MSDKVISVTEQGLYGASSILKKIGIDKINSDAIYTFTNKSNDAKNNSLAFLFNGQVKQNETTVAVKGKDLYRLTIRVGQSRDSYKETPIVVEEKIDGVVQKEHKFTLSAAQRIFVEGNQAPETTVKNYLTRGDHKANDVVTYIDSEGDSAQTILLNVGNSKHHNGLKLVFGGVEIEKGGDFYFTPQQLQQLVFRVPQQGYFSDEIHASVTDVYGERSTLKTVTLFSQIAVQELGLYEANFILEKAGIKTKSNAVYTSKNESQYVAGGSLTYVFNGKIRHNEAVISVRGKDFYRFTIQAAQSRAHYKNTPMTVQERIDGIIQKEYKFSVSSNESILKENNQAPRMTVKAQLSRGDNDAKGIFTYSDPENDLIRNIALDMRYLKDKGNLTLVFDGTEVKGRGLFSFMPQQLQWLKLRVPEHGPFSDEVYTSIADIYGSLSELKATNFLVGQ